MKQDNRNAAPVALLAVIVLACAVAYQSQKNTPPPATPSTPAEKPEERRTVEPVAAETTKSIVLFTTQGCAPCEQIKKTLPYIADFEFYVLEDTDPRVIGLLGEVPTSFPYVAVFDDATPDGTREPIYQGPTSVKGFPQLLKEYR